MTGTMKASFKNPLPCRLTYLNFMKATWTSRLKAGQTVPHFTALLQDGSTISDAQLKGKAYILFFYNHDGSETCTKEACNIRDGYQQLKKKGYLVFGVSEDGVKKHQKFIAKYQLPYPLMADEGNTIAKAFDIYGKKEFMGRISDAVHRTTFVINENGKIAVVIHPVDSANHVDQILDSLANTKSS
jgi:peroxiredoxin Q/BCP